MTLSVGGPTTVAKPAPALALQYKRAPKTFTLPKGVDSSRACHERRQYEKNFCRPTLSRRRFSRYRFPPHDLRPTGGGHSSRHSISARKLTEGNNSSPNAQQPIKEIQYCPPKSTTTMPPALPHGTAFPTAQNLSKMTTLLARGQGGAPSVPRSTPARIWDTRADAIHVTANQKHHLGKDPPASLPPFTEGFVTDAYQQPRIRLRTKGKDSPSNAIIYHPRRMRLTGATATALVLAHLTRALPHGARTGCMVSASVSIPQGTSLPTLASHPVSSHPPTRQI